MGIRAQGLSLLGEESFRTSLTDSLYIAPVPVMLSLVLRRGANFYELASLPLAATSPRRLGLLIARGRFVTNSMEMLKEDTTRLVGNFSIYS